MITELLAKHLQGTTAVSILDVGPGYSDFGRIAAGVTGARRIAYLDCDESVLAWQAAACRKTGLEVRCLHARLDTGDPPPISETFDVILCQEVLEHLSNAEAVLTALVRCLNPGGRVVVTVPTKASERWLSRVNSSYMRHATHGHVRLFDEPGLRELLDAAGLEPVTLIPTQPHYFVFHTWIVGARMRVDWSTGKILTGGLRKRIGKILLSLGRRFFVLTGLERWGRLLPRNYFVVAQMKCKGR
jgi:SAM-dependent methyltransferase